MPAAVGEEPMARPISSERAAIAVLISAPAPASVQAIGAPASLSNHFSPLAIIVGLVSRKKPPRIVCGALPAASRTCAGRAEVKAAPLIRAVLTKRRRFNVPE